MPEFPEFMRVILATLAFITGGEDISRHETLCLSKAVYHEVRNQPLTTQMTIASFLQQFAERNSTTICEEIYHSHGTRYPWVKTRAQIDTDNPIEHEAWRHAVLISVLTIKGHIRYDVGDATHFLMPNAIKRLPNWYDPESVVFTSGVVEFLRLKDYK